MAVHGPQSWFTFWIFTLHSIPILSGLLRLDRYSSILIIWIGISLVYSMHHTAPSWHCSAELGDSHSLVSLLGRDCCSYISFYTACLHPISTQFYGDWHSPITISVPLGGLALPYFNPCFHVPPCSAPLTVWALYCWKCTSQSLRFALLNSQDRSYWILTMSTPQSPLELLTLNCHWFIPFPHLQHLLCTPRFQAALRILLSPLSTKHIILLCKPPF